MHASCWHCAQPQGHDQLPHVSGILHSAVLVAAQWQQHALDRMGVSVGPLCHHFSLLCYGRVASVLGSTLQLLHTRCHAPAQGRVVSAHMYWNRCISPTTLRALSDATISSSCFCLCHCCLSFRCCYYGGSDPVEAEQVVRQMCLAADTEPDAATARLLASVDISWQQLHCGC